MDGRSERSYIDMCGDFLAESIDAAQGRVTGRHMRELRPQEASWRASVAVATLPACTVRTRVPVICATFGCWRLYHEGSVHPFNQEKGKARWLLQETLAMDETARLRGLLLECVELNEWTIEKADAGEDEAWRFQLALTPGPKLLNVWAPTHKPVIIIVAGLSVSSGSHKIFTELDATERMLFVNDLQLRLCTFPVEINLDFEAEEDELDVAFAATLFNEDCTLSGIHHGALAVHRAFVTTHLLLMRLQLREGWWS